MARSAVSTGGYRDWFHPQGSAARIGDGCGSPFFLLGACTRSHSAQGRLDSRRPIPDIAAVVVVPAPDLRRARSASLAAQRRIAASTHRGIPVSECDHGHFYAADLCRRIHALGVSESLLVGLCPFGIAGTSAARIRGNTGGFFAAGRWNRRS